MTIGQFASEHVVEIVFGVVTAALSAYAIRLKIREQQQTLEGIVGADRKASLFLSRAAMAKALVEMYSHAERGDVIWGQCIGCDEYTPDVQGLILRAASKGVRHKVIVNAYAPTLEEFRAVFDPLSTAEVVEGRDNAVRIQGLSDKEVVVSIPELARYTGLLIRDAGVVGILREWFDHRFDDIAAMPPAQ